MGFFNWPCLSLLPQNLRARASGTSHLSALLHTGLDNCANKGKTSIGLAGTATRMFPVLGASSELAHLGYPRQQHRRHNLQSAEVDRRILAVICAFLQPESIVLQRGAPALETKIRGLSNQA